MTTIKQFLCGATVAGLVAGTGAAIGAPLSLLHSADWWLAAEHVLLIGTDGTNLSKILEYAYNDDSGFKMLMDRGVTAATTIAGHMTMSTPSWSTILTGVWDDKHGVVSNVYRPEPYTTWPSVFNLLEYNKPEIDTTVISGRGLFTDMASTGGYPADNIIGISGGSTSAEIDPNLIFYCMSRGIPEAEARALLPALAGRAHRGHHLSRQGRGHSHHRLPGAGRIRGTAEPLGRPALAFRPPSGGEHGQPRYHHLQRCRRSGAHLHPDRRAEGQYLGP